jgi:hypothetical protein
MIKHYINIKLKDSRVIETTVDDILQECTSDSKIIFDYFSVRKSSKSSEISMNIDVALFGLKDRLKNGMNINPMIERIKKIPLASLRSKDKNIIEKRDTLIDNINILVKKLDQI